MKDIFARLAKRRSEGGFGLVELIVVIAILGILYPRHPRHCSYSRLRCHPG